MMADALALNCEFYAAPPDEGSLRLDLIALLTRFAASFEAVGIETFRGFLGEADDEVMGNLMRITGEFASVGLRQILEVAHARGELGVADLPHRVLVLPIVLVRYEIVFQRPFSPDAIESIVDEVCLPALTAVGRTFGAEAH